MVHKVKSWGGHGVVLAPHWSYLGSMEKRNNKREIEALITELTDLVEKLDIQADNDRYAAVCLHVELGPRLASGVLRAAKIWPDWPDPA